MNKTLLLCLVLFCLSCETVVSRESAASLWVPVPGVDVGNEAARRRRERTFTVYDTDESGAMMRCERYKKLYCGYCDTTGEYPQCTSTSPGCLARVYCQLER